MICIMSKMVSEPQDPGLVCQGWGVWEESGAPTVGRPRVSLCVTRHRGAEVGKLDACSTLHSARKFLLNMCSFLFEPDNDFFFSFSSG